MVKKQILAFMQAQQFPIEAVNSLTNAVECIFESEAKEIIENLVEQYQQDYHIKADEMTAKSKKISDYVYGTS